jgi:hypothetical protein
LLFSLLAVVIWLPVVLFKGLREKGWGFIVYGL